jgi:hypothetical protein
MTLLGSPFVSRYTAAIPLKLQLNDGLVASVRLLGTLSKVEVSGKALLWFWSKNSRMSLPLPPRFKVPKMLAKSCAAWPRRKILVPLPPLMVTGTLVYQEVPRGLNLENVAPRAPGDGNAFRVSELVENVAWRQPADFAVGLAAQGDGVQVRGSACEVRGVVHFHVGVERRVLNGEVAADIIDVLEDLLELLRVMALAKSFAKNAPLNLCRKSAFFLEASLTGHKIRLE